MSINTKLKYILTYSLFILLIVGCDKIEEIISGKKISLTITVYSECLALSEAEIIIDDKVQGKTDADGKLEMQISFDEDSPEKKVKINAGGQTWIENIALNEEDKIVERVIFFRQESSDVIIQPAPDNISYSIIDLDTKCEIYSNEMGPSVKKLIVDRPYRIRYSMDPDFNKTVFEKRFIPSGIEDKIEFSIYELKIIADFDELSYELLENGTNVDFGFGSARYYYNDEQDITIKPHKGQLVSVNIRDGKWKYVEHIDGEKTLIRGDKTANIRVSDQSAAWRIINSNTKEEVYSGKGDAVVEELFPGKYVLKEVGSYNDLRTKEFILSASNSDIYVNIDLRRLDVAILPYPNDVKWEISKKGKSILKSGTGSSKIKGLPANTSYYARCIKTDGSKTKWKSFELIKNNQLVELECFSACIDPYINIQVTPVDAVWDLKKSDGNTAYSIYQSGTGNARIKVELEKLYRLTAKYNDIEVTSKVVNFTNSHKSCREIIDINMDSNEILLNEACDNSEWDQVVSLDKKANFRSNMECDYYLCLANAYSVQGANEKALNIIIDGWNQAEQKQLCLDFRTDDRYIFTLLQLIEKYGLGSENIAEKKLNNIIDVIKDLPLGSNTELKAVYIYLAIKINDLKDKKSEWNNSDQSYRNENRDEFCEEINNLRDDGAYSIERLKYLMNLVGSFMYSKTVDNIFELQLERASRAFNCP